MATQQTILYLAVCDSCGAADNESWPGFEFEDEAEENAVEEEGWIYIGDELTCLDCQGELNNENR